jgi:hypothetical protein
MIRPSLMKDVCDALGSHSYLSAGDFEIQDHTDRDDNPYVSIIYRYDASRQFAFSIPKSRTQNPFTSKKHYRFRVTMRPGWEWPDETLDADERSGLLDEIKAWVGRIYEDTVSVSVVRQFQAQSSALEELRARLERVPDEVLSSDDVTRFREGLDELKAELSDQLSREIADKEELKTRVAELARDIEFLKQTLDSMSKRQWGAVLFARLGKWKDKLSLRHLSSGAKMLRVLLPQESSDTIDTITEAIDQVADEIDKTQG